MKTPAGILDLLCVLRACHQRSNLDRRASARIRSEQRAPDKVILVEGEIEPGWFAVL